jgi:hypothetical protein
VFRTETFELFLQSKFTQYKYWSLSLAHFSPNGLATFPVADNLQYRNMMVSTLGFRDKVREVVFGAHWKDASRSIIDKLERGNGRTFNMSYVRYEIELAEVQFGILISRAIVDASGKEILLPTGLSTVEFYKSLIGKLVFTAEGERFYLDSLAKLVEHGDQTLRTPIKSKISSPMVSKERAPIDSSRDSRAKVTRQTISKPCMRFLAVSLGLSVPPCKFGDKCEFLHAEPEDISLSVALNSLKRMKGFPPEAMEEFKALLSARCKKD